ncbi:hypothetical protein NBRC116601_09760 [Cognatishimia sp. WU-CL00825]|uniref:hypothetical protein n=1 Tax=Cognatishimia sp. WU-CL00825 TaxID=3127658 RepID=UPI00310666A3
MRRPNWPVFAGEATAAYQSLSPEMTRAEGEIYFARNSYFANADKLNAQNGFF